jgi:murein DD-endopeptidase MepM/ murein hydrolase activator NlpD
MRPPRTALVPAVAAVVVAAAVLAGTAGSAQADNGVSLPSVTPLPSVTLPVPLPSVSVPPVPVPTPPAPSVPSLPASPSLPGGGGGGDGSGGGSAGGSGGGSGGSGASTATGTQGATTTTRAARKAARRMADATPILAGTPAARDLVDDESSPELYRASQSFLTADQGIAEIARQKRLMARLKLDAMTTAQLYRAMGYDVAGAERVAAAWHQRYDGLAASAGAGESRRVGDSATRADERLGELVVGRALVKVQFEQVAARYAEAKKALADANAQVATLSAQRSTALSAIQAAGGNEIALNQARAVEAGQLGTQIENLSEQLAKHGDTVQGTGSFVHPLDGIITSPFGMRFHPILHYRKLHTGTDFAGGSIIRAADDGRVIMTMLSSAYGNFTVIDHGMVNGKHLTTAYAHQSRFLVRQGQVVHKGDPIGIVGSTGYATGPHLHFEVRENGSVIDPMRMLRH